MSSLLTYLAYLPTYLFIYCRLLVYLLTTYALTTLTFVTLLTHSLTHLLILREPNQGRRLHWCDKDELLVLASRESQAGRLAGSGGSRVGPGGDPPPAVPPPVLTPVPPPVPPQEEPLEPLEA